MKKMCGPDGGGRGSRGSYSFEGFLVLHNQVYENTCQLDKTDSNSVEVIIKATSNPNMAPIHFFF